MANHRKEGDVQHRIEGRISRSEGLLNAIGFSQEAFLRLALNALVTNPEIADCDPDSVDQAIVKCLNAGLVPDGDEATIAVFAGKAGVIWGYKGLMANARKTTPALSLWAATVWKEDKFVHRAGAHPVLEHEYDEFCPHTPENVRACYAVAWLPGAKFPEIEVMYRNEIDRHKAFASKKSQGQGWKGSYGEMGEKSCIIQICKRLPRRPEHRDDSDRLFAEGGARTAALALEHIPSRTLSGNGAQPAKASAKTRATAKPKARAAPAPQSEEQPPIDSYEDDSSPF